MGAVSLIKKIAYGKLEPGKTYNLFQVSANKETINHVGKWIIEDISKDKIIASNDSVNKQIISAYTYIYNTSTNMMFGFRYRLW